MAIRPNGAAGCSVPALLPGASVGVRGGRGRPRGRSILTNVDVHQHRWTPSVVAALRSCDEWALTRTSHPPIRTRPAWTGVGQGNPEGSPPVSGTSVSHPTPVHMTDKKLSHTDRNAGSAGARCDWHDCWSSAQRVRRTEPGRRHRAVGPAGRGRWSAVGMVRPDLRRGLTPARGDRRARGDRTSGGHLRDPRLRPPPTDRLQPGPDRPGGDPRPLPPRAGPGYETADGDRLRPALRAPHRPSA